METTVAERLRIMANDVAKNAEELVGNVDRLSEIIVEISVSAEMDHYLVKRKIIIPSAKTLEELMNERNAELLKNRNKQE